MSNPRSDSPLAKSFTTEVRNMFENLWSLPRVIRQIVRYTDFFLYAPMLRQR